MKKTMVALALAAGLACGQAHAIPVLWTLNGNHADGSFTYDASTNAYTSVSVSTLLVTYTQLGSGNNALNLNLVNGLAFLNIDFLAPLTDAGGSIGYTSASGILGFVTSDGRGTATGGTTSVPEPGSLVLFGAGLVGFALMRRRTKAA
jgi:hypothetical protein